MTTPAETPREAYFELDELERAHARGAQFAHRFFRVPSLRMTLYKLPAGADDPQTPHEDDEIYYVLEGRANFRVEDDVRPVKPGTIIFVRAKAPHKFIDITEDLSVLVFFSHYQPHSDPH